MRTACLSLVLIFLVVVIPCGVSAGEFLYTGDSLPSGAGWSIYGSASLENGGGITSTNPSDGGSNVWRLVDASGTNRCSERHTGLGDVSFNRGISLAANIKCESAAGSSFNLGISNGNVGGVCLRIRPDQAALSLFDGAEQGTPYSFTPDTTNYHRYYLTVLNSVQGDNGSAVWNVYRDGQLIITHNAAGVHDGYDGFFAGHAGAVGTGTWCFDWIAGNNDGAYGPGLWDPIGPPAAPSVISPVSGAVVPTRTPFIQWTGASHDAYEAHINSVNSPETGIVWDSGSVSSSANSCVSGSLANGSYYVFVRIHGAAGWGQWSATGHTFTVSIPRAPTVVYPGDGSTIATRTPLAQWSGDAHDAYETHINSSDTPDSNIVWDSGAVSSSADSCLSDTLANGTYYLFVRLHNEMGWGPWSANGHSFTVYVTAGDPAAPAIVTPTVGANVAIAAPVVRWIGDAHDSYEVHINTTGSPSDADAWDSGQVSGTNDVCDAPAIANGPYYVFVRLHNGAGWGPWSSGRAFNINVIGPAAKKGWVMIRDDVPYHLDLLTHAREYHVNHVQLSHSIMMYAWQPINDITVRNNVNQLIDAAHANGVSEVVLWVHDVQFTNMPSQYLIGGKVNLDDPGFWTWMDGQYELLFQVCPNADGLVFTFSENFSGADFDDRLKTIHTGKTPEDTMAQAIQTIWNVCGRHNKSLYVRTWAGAGPDRWVRNAIMRNDPRIWMMSKATGAADWDVIQEDYDIIGTCVGHPDLVEFDFVGEYWGYTYTPRAGIEYMRHLWSEFALPRGADGMVARVDREDRADTGIVPRTIECPNRIDMFALDALADYPDLAADDIYDYWSSHWFGSVADRVASSLKRTFDITNACYGRPNIYPFSTVVAGDYCLRSLFDIDCAKAVLSSTTILRPGYTDYNTFRTRLTNAAGRLGLAVPSTLFGDFSPADSSQTTPTCSVTVVDAATGLNPSLFKVEYSTDGGSTWTNYLNFTYSADGGPTDPYHITANSVPFGQLRAARNKLRFSATNLSSVTATKVYTVRGMDNGYATLASTVTSDGISHPQTGDGDTVGATAGGRACRTLATSGDVNFYFRTDDGFAYDRSPQTVYLQVDYYGSSGSITPYYDSIWRTDEPLAPVYLSGGTGWRTATWRLDNVNFGHRIGSQGADVLLYVGSAANVVYISGVRLYYNSPSGMLGQPSDTRATSLSSSQVGLTWNSVPGATKYQVCRGGAAVSWPTGTVFTDSGLSPNTEYNYTVAAYDNSGNTSCATRAVYALTLSPPPTTSNVTSNPAAATWQTSGNFQFTAVGGFGYGKAAYYQYAWDESPTHIWTGSEPTWPALGPPQGGGWTVWRPLISPTDPASGWLLFEGSTTQRLMSEALVTDYGAPAWLLTDQGRIFNTKAKISLWPNLSIDRDTGATVTVRMRAGDSPLGWFNTGSNFGINLLDCPQLGVIVRPDYLQIIGPSGNSPGQSVSNGYTYHTYTLTVKNATPGNNATARYDLYRDGSLVTSLTQGPSTAGVWSGPWFGQVTSNALGVWAWQWIAWNTSGAFAPSPGTGTLTVTAPHYGSGYYLHLKGFNANGVPNGTLDLGPYYYWNGSTPVSPTVTDDGAYTTADAIHVRWSPVGPSPNHYEYAIGSSAGAQDIAPFANVGLSLETTRTGLALAEGNTYYVTVKGFVGSNNYTGSSDGVTAAPRQEKVAGAKALADGAPAALYGKTVTAVFPDCAYIQERYEMGIRVVTNRPMTVGTVVDMAGTLAGSETEKLLAADAVFPTGAGSIDPPSMSERSIGGQAFMYDPVANTGQAGVKAYASSSGGSLLVDVPGLNTIGSLIRTWGRVTWVGVDSFYIDDGSGYDDYPEIGPGSPAGIKVAVPAGVTPPATGSYAVVTGVSSVYDSDIGLCRVLLVRQQSDIQGF
ncbi:MAG: hypothetical protein Q7T82_02165 [Armatimonadota bacterium]|nr:hypothetical protein [Armatimonadota bacterium]